MTNLEPKPKDLVDDFLGPMSMLIVICITIVFSIRACNPDIIHLPCECEKKKIGAVWKK